MLFTDLGLHVRLRTRMTGVLEQMFDKMNGPDFGWENVCVGSIQQPLHIMPKMLRHAPLMNNATDENNKVNNCERENRSLLVQTNCRSSTFRAQPWPLIEQDKCLSHFVDRTHPVSKIINWAVTDMMDATPHSTATVFPQQCPTGESIH